MRAAYRATAQRLTSGTKAVQGAAEELRRRLPADMVTPEGEVLLPMSREGIRVAVLNAERYADRAVERQVKAGRVQVGVLGGGNLFVCLYAYLHALARSSVVHMFNMV